MPIGKNSIKRVANAGYSKAKAEPEVDTREVKAEVKAPEEKKKAASATKKPAAKKPTAKKSATAEKKPEVKAPSAKKPAKKKIEPLVSAAKFAVGDELPTYLL